MEVHGNEKGMGSHALLGGRLLDLLRVMPVLWSCGQWATSLAGEPRNTQLNVYKCFVRFGLTHNMLNVLGGAVDASAGCLASIALFRIFKSQAFKAPPFFVCSYPLIQVDGTANPAAIKGGVYIKYNSKSQCLHIRMKAGVKGGAMHE
eukprot:1143124-Pelagomonas_calceolata.AAC.1